MPIIGSEQSEIEGLLNVAKLMMVSARTAPKSGGKDNIETLLVYGEEKNRISEEMEKIGRERNSEGFIRDALNTRESTCILLIGVEGTKSFGIDCGGCGYNSCRDFENIAKIKRSDYSGSNCIFKLLDMGIALGSAVKTAMIHNADNRIMYRIGTAAIRIGLIKKSSIVMGIPLSATGKSVYFDR